MPKRKLSDVEDDEPVASPTTAAETTVTTDGPEPPVTASPASPTECSDITTPCIPQAAGDSADLPGCSTDMNGASTSTQEEFTQLRKKRKSVKFNGVTVYYFPRKQGFICVPSQGGSTLGMSEKHMQQEKFTVGDYARSQRRLHKQILREQQKAAGIASKRSTRQKSDDSSSVTSDTSSDSEEELNVDDYYFLQPVPTRQRRILLRQSGIKKIDTVEKEECRDIRSSREMCGCDCRVYCDPETCACAIEGIKCQVDRLSFPCGCSKDGCSNPVGRIEFNPIRVRTHFIHTVMRLEMDRKREQITQMCAPRTTCDYPQTSQEGDSVAHHEMNTEESCNNDVETQESMDDICESEMLSPNRKVAKFDFSENSAVNDNENDPTTTTNDDNTIETLTDTQSQSSSTSSNNTEPPPIKQPKKSCLKRRNSADSKNAPPVTQFNSNERGSCRDCGNTDVTEMLMAGAHFVESTTPIEMEPIIPSQTKVVDCTNSAPEPSDAMDVRAQQHVGENCQQAHFQQVMMFGEGEEEEYAGENGGMYGFKPEESSYSESSDPDCCSEGSDDGAQAQQGGAGQYSTCSSSTDPNTSAAHYCIPGSSYEASTAQPEQKYMDLNSSTSGYKLEPISEILNPLRFTNYDSCSLNHHHQGWHTGNSAGYQYGDGSGTGTLPRYPARYPSMQAHNQENSQSAGSAIGNQGYYQHNNNTEQSTTNVLPYQQQQQQQHPPLSHQTNTNNSNNYHSHHQHNNHETSSTSACPALPSCIPAAVLGGAGDKSCDLPFNQSDSTPSVVKDTDEDSGFKDLSASSSTASSPVKDEDDVTKYQDLTSSSSSTSGCVTSTSQFTDLNMTSSPVKSAAPVELTASAIVTSDDDTNCRYTTLLSPTRHNSSDSSTSAECAGSSTKCKIQDVTTAPALYQELNEEYILPKRTSVVAVAAPSDNNTTMISSSSPNSQNEIKCNDEIIQSTTVSATDAHQNGEEEGQVTSKTVVSENVSSNRESQNFGEIIKESIVETVSA